jgi:hypothetical protein
MKDDLNLLALASPELGTAQPQLFSSSVLCYCKEALSVQRTTKEPTQ